VRRVKAAMGSCASRQCAARPTKALVSSCAGRVWRGLHDAASEGSDGLLHRDGMAAAREGTVELGGLGAVELGRGKTRSSAVY
jgi:hypothetical protein